MLNIAAFAMSRCAGSALMEIMVNISVKLAIKKLFGRMRQNLLLSNDLMIDELKILKENFNKILK